MSLTRHSRWLVLVATVVCLLLTSGAAWGQDPYGPTGNEFSFAVNYFSNNVNHPSGTDEVVRIVNTGSVAPNYPPSPLCAMIYVFDNWQEMKACCSCLISANGLAELQVAADLTFNTFNGAVPNDGDIKIISAYTNNAWGYQPPSGPPVVANNNCDPSGGGFSTSGGFVDNIVPVAGLVAWSTHLTGYKAADGYLAESEFVKADYSTGELHSLQDQCAGIIQEGSGAGICFGEVPNSSTICGFTR